MVAQNVSTRLFPDSGKRNVIIQSSVDCFVNSMEVGKWKQVTACVVSSREGPSGGNEDNRTMTSYWLPVATF